MTQYIKITIRPGQKKRADISDWVLPTGEFIWIGQDTDVFDPSAPVGDVSANESPPPTTYIYSACTQEDIDNLAQLSFLERDEVRNNRISRVLVDCVKGIIELFKVGREKGVWLATDFDAELRSRFSEWQDIIDEHENDNIEPPEE